ncbi:DNA mismatch repair protein MutL [Filimonas lacunae]|uniref:DNA mismatch repair protein MutL n=1 Tax=Filimonas lacunae TaxID=477680 RepID=A0A173MQY2_9BACT|nr:DNA mismatch repair endonuclease MutL [Filimonas lacunae]BAV10073.1 DNA mismatch repair protein MutL [Filimonas lacunae]SIS83582.1 DNA mismatch repair protein MutL [Filimonas lacunae]
MPDIIQLLPDNIANQIAAGEVIQRPASAVKELLENAVDAGATEIRLIVNDAGKSLMQVIDNGKGMSETDARMSFERHATSKIKNIDDLFQVRTMGFRGEALASIAAVAQVELKSRRAEDELGTYVEIENSAVIKQEPCACPLGTSISMKNLFFNIPARRNFLKSNAAEMRHIIDEFIHVAMAFPHIFFSFTANGVEQFHLEAGSLKQRILQLMGNQHSSKLVQVKEDTDYMNISGFVGKPETARKTRGDQYFFVNNRFIKSPYLNHAVMSAFEGMLPKDCFPLYVLFIDLDPTQVDINVHPTKQEIKFEDEKIIYAFVQAAVKHSLATFSVAPSLDFTLNPIIQQLDAVSKPFTDDQQQSASGSDLYKTFTQKHQAHAIEGSNKAELKHWKDAFTPLGRESSNSGGGYTGSNSNAAADQYNAGKYTDQGMSNKGQNSTSAGGWAQPGERKLPGLTGEGSAFDEIGGISTGGIDSLYSLEIPAARQLIQGAPLLQLHNTYVLAPVTSGFIVVHQQLAHERILYERYSIAAHSQSMASQQSLFPVTLELAAADAALLHDLLPELKAIGYQVEPFGKDSFIIQGTPADISQGNERHSIELLIEQFKHFSSDIKFSKREKLVRCMARQQAIKAGQVLSQQEMATLVEELLKCSTPNVTPTGNPTYLEYKEDYLDKMFGR